MKSFNSVMKQIAKTVKAPVWRRRIIPTMAIAGTVVILGGIGVYALGFDKTAPFGTGSPDSAVSDVEAVGEAGGTIHNDIAAAPMLNQFLMSGSSYILLDQGTADSFGLNISPVPEDIGEKITDITDAPDESLIGCSVYRYLPAGSEAVVAVKIGELYQLYRFFTFEKYEDNGDEDAAAYLAIYGIDAPSDIKEIQFIRYGDQAKPENQGDVAAVMDDETNIAQFYGHYSVIKDSSTAYFDKLFSYKKDITEEEGIPSGNNEPAIGFAPDTQSPEVYENEASTHVNVTATGYAEDKPATTPYDTGSSVPDSPGTVGDTLADSVIIRIYNHSGLYYDTPYYPNLGFISRHEVSEEFADFLANYL